MRKRGWRVAFLVVTAMGLVVYLGQVGMADDPLTSTSSSSGTSDPPPPGFANMVEKVICPAGEETIGGIIADAIYGDNPLPDTPEAALTKFVENLYPSLNSGDFWPIYVGTDRAQYRFGDHRIIVEIKNIGGQGWSFTSMAGCNSTLQSGL
jgi:hypothetical protein